jgi:hypothetical protein
LLSEKARHGKAGKKNKNMYSIKWYLHKNVNICNKEKNVVVYLSVFGKENRSLGTVEIWG